MNVRKTGMMATVLLFILCSFSLFAQGTQSQTPQKEEIVLTTYYPVPYGDYDKFLVKRMAVGDVNGDGQVNAADIPSQDGQLSVAKSVIFNPQQNAPTSWPAGSAGELAFSKDEGAFYYYNGSKWVAQSGGGGTSLVGWGTTQCPDGWQVYYTGYAMQGVMYFYNGGSVPGGGTPVCKSGAPIQDLQYPGYWGLVWGTHSGDIATSDIPCVVCVK